MALTPSSPYLLHFPHHSPSATTHQLLFPDLASSSSFLQSPWAPSHKSKVSAISPIVIKEAPSSRVICMSKSTAEEDRLIERETIATSGNDDDDDDPKAPHQSSVPTTGSIGPQRVSTSLSDSLSLGIREPVYEVVEVKSNGMVSTRKINRRQLLKSSGLRPRDIRSVDPSLFLTNSMPCLLVREHAILLNLGSLRAMAMHECVRIFDYNSKGGKAFIETLLPRLNPKNGHGGQCMPFEIEVQALLDVLPNRLTADILEQLRISKQTLVELGSRAGALRQMLLDLLEDPEEIRLMCIMGKNCTLKKGNDEVECSVPLEKQIAEEEEEEIEMLLENYLQRCESCHGQAERLLDSAKEMEDSIAVNLSSRRLEVSRVELLLQVGTFCVAIGALVAGIFGMNLRSYLEEHVFAFWLTTAGIIVGGVVAFFLMYSYLKARKIL
ncbi:magnesium transporter MRS2-11, chloroplastic isoform X2 [Carya illinoinensis]|uniref:magnesium transporter MRS2-11, chloroplastic isoform X2 n=1 Tax=Carya illinoinensis TaxID=32201 RepID=UPI001C71A3CF|nr:magnesium transporter MRS2-11, chloroplastic isoform X2 [Carya illinoinensis]